MTRKVGSNHYLATPQPGSLLAGYWTDGADSQRTDLSNGYYVHNERQHVIPSPVSQRSRRGKSLDDVHRRGASPHLSAHSRASPHLSAHSRASPGANSRASPGANSRRSHQSRRSRSAHSQRSPRDNDSDIYITSAAYQHAPSRLSRGSRRLVSPSEMSVRSKVSRKGGVVVETMSAPNPFCPNTRGCCCLLLLINLAIILITLGFVIVLQFYEPVFVWILGIIFLIFGFVALAVSMVYCVWVCKDAKTPRQVAEEDHYWTRHWQKNFGLPEIHYQGEKNLENDRYSNSPYPQKPRY